jgi:cation transport protein ChaC
MEKDKQNEDLWIFAYGSLIWRPDFDYCEAKTATIHGMQRSLCIYSYVYRGTPEKPGLTLGLDRCTPGQTASCKGLAYRIAKNKENEVLMMLRKREQINGIYHEICHPVTLETGQTIKATTFIVDRAHEQYVGSLSFERQYEIVKNASGQSGTNCAYVIETAKAMQNYGINDETLNRLAQALASK